ncbi:MAG: CoA-binding protein [Candidatus Nanoarchaeia archaeon]|nr:CoA-binding protein [Candidatus Nanoarchaeia archaeon]
MNKFFEAKSIAVVGVSRNKDKVGHIIFSQLLRGFKGEIYGINPNLNELYGNKIYKDLPSLNRKIDLVVIAIPAPLVIDIIRELPSVQCKNVVIISAGFKEIGNEKLELELKKEIEKRNIKAIGVNCLGIYDSFSGIDAIFLPSDRVHRPKKGKISFVCQSGAIGGAVLDLMASKGYGINKFISYGNATSLDETDFIDYLGKDKDTKVICVYVEGIKDGRKFLEVCKKIKKPIVILKGGLTAEGNKAALSHTGALAGDPRVYIGAFKQANLVYAESIEDLFNYARLLEKSLAPKGDNIQIITNGGGFGIISTDSIINNDLSMAELSQKTRKELRETFPKLVIVDNPMDLIGDATDERYDIALDRCASDKNIDVILVVLDFQTPLLTPRIVDVISKYKDKKPVILVATGGEPTEKIKRIIESKGIVCFDYPETAVRSIKRLVDYYNKI